MATVNLGSIKFKWKGTYSGATAYTVDDVVEYNGSSYICILASTGNLPTNATYFEQMSQKGTDADLLSIASTAQGDIYYNNGGAIARLGVGTSGQFLKTLGTGANPTWADAGGGFQSMQVFSTSGSHTWTKPAGITKIKVYVTGSGGSGGGWGTANDVGSGGGAGGTAIKVIDVSAVSSVAVTIGAGGAGISSGGNGNSGATSSFGAYCSATGGGYGKDGNAGYDIIGGSAGIGSGGDLNIQGGSGEAGFDTGSSHDNGGGSGGVSFWAGTS
jgi:hypothetical protein